MDNGWIKLFYRLLDWEWYSDTNMVRLFIHLLLKANYKPQRYKGQVVKRGSLITTLNDLHLETGLSQQQVRTCLKRLKSTNEITISATNQHHIITLCKYAIYQSDSADANTPNNKRNNKRVTNEQQTNNNQITNPIYIKERKKGRKEDDGARARVSPPPLPSVQEDCFRGLSIDQKLDKFIAEAAKSQVWLESVAKNLQMQPPQVVALMQGAFRDHCIREDKRHDNISDFKSHFNRWASQQKYSSHHNETITAPDPKRNNDAAAARQQEFARHINGKLAAPDSPEPDLSGNY